MTITYGMILQYEATNSLADAYTVPANTSHIIGTIYMCNFTASPVTITIKVAKAGAANANSQYIYATVTLDAYETKESTSGLSIEETDVIRIQASANNSVSVNLSGKTIYA